MASSFIRATVPLGMFLLSSLAAQAATVGPLTVHSRLGQGFVGSIEVVGEKAELDDLKVSQGSTEAYIRNGLEYDPAVRGLNLQVERQGDKRAVLRLRSSNTFNQPIGALLLDFRWAGGSITRDYTFLLDPPEEIVKVVVPPNLGGSSPATSAVAAAVPAPAVQPGTAGSAEPSSPGTVSPNAQQYRTQTGDSLARIAGKNRIGQASRMQTMAAIYQANPQAFVGGNAARLRRDAVLNLPAEADALKLSEAESRKLVMGTGEFEKHRQAVAVAAGAGPASDAEASRSAAGQIAPSVDEPVARQASGRLRIGEGKPSAATRKKIEALEEEIASKAKSLEEQNSRIQELEVTMEQLNKLLAMQSAPASPSESVAAGQPAPGSESQVAASAEPAVTQAAALANVPEPTTVAATDTQATGLMDARAQVMTSARMPGNWYEDTAVQTLMLIIASGAAAWVAYRRYRERKWREADRELQRQRGMPVDESSVLSMA